MFFPSKLTKKHVVTSKRTKPATVTVNEWRRSPSSTLSAEHHGKCTLIGTRRGPGGQHRQATSWTRARRSPRSSRTSCSSSTSPSEDVLRANMIVASKAELRRGQYTCRQGWHRRANQRGRQCVCASSENRAARLGEAARANQSVDEAASAAPHRAWPWPLMPARPHPVRPRCPLGQRQQSRSTKKAKIEGCYRKTACCSFDEQVKNKTTKRPTPRFRRTSRLQRVASTTRTLASWRLR